MAARPTVAITDSDLASTEDERVLREAALDEAVAGGIDPALDVRPEPVRDGVGEAVVGQGLGHAGPPG